MALKPFLLFTAPSASERKNFVTSFASPAEAVEAGKKLKGDGPMRWQVIENASSKVVADDPGTEIDGGAQKESGPAARALRNSREIP